MKQELHQCPSCGFWYKTKELAKKCRQWCDKYHSCSIEITKHAVKPKRHYPKSE